MSLIAVYLRGSIRHYFMFSKVLIVFFFHSDNSITTMISFNRGGEWNTIPLTEKQCKGVKLEVSELHLMQNDV